MTIDAYVSSWAAWSPGITSADAWRRWAADPYVPGDSGAPGQSQTPQAPDAKFLPSLLRRRCTPLSRMMLTAAYDCLGYRDPTRVTPVFTSRHGSINESISMLEKVAIEQKLSPAMFAHTVHNAQAALFSLASGNRETSSALCAEDESFEAGYLEALLQLHRRPDQPVLLVVGDVPLAPGFAALIDEPPSSFAAAFVLESNADATKISFEMPQEREHDDGPDYAWPTALEFLRWFLSEERCLDLTGQRHAWRWRKT